MANLTKEQRIAREAAKEAQLKSELEAKIKGELEEKLRAEYEEKLKSVETDVKSVTKDIKNFIKIPLDTVVPVICNVVGGAVYESQKFKGYPISWDSFGSIEYMELSELVSMRNTARRFFEDNWIILGDTEDYSSAELYDFLKVSQYYKNIYTPENIDNIFELDPNEIIKTISNLSKGMKSTIATRAKEKIDAKELDSNNKIKALEAALDVTFII